MVLYLPIRARESLQHTIVMASVLDLELRKRLMPEPISGTLSLTTVLIAGYNTPCLSGRGAFDGPIQRSYSVFGYVRPML